MERGGFIPEGTYSSDEIDSLYSIYKLDRALTAAEREGRIDQPSAEEFRNAIGDAKMLLLPKTLGGGSKENIKDNDILWGQIGTGAINVLGGLCEGVAGLSITWFAGQAKGLAMYWHGSQVGGIGLEQIFYGAKGEELKADTPFGNIMKAFTDNQLAIDSANIGDLAFTGYSSYQGFVNADSNSIFGHGMLANFADDAVSSTVVSGGIVDAWNKFVNWVKGND